LAPYWSSSATMSPCPLWAANISAVSPSLSRAFTSAPRSKRLMTAAVSPLKAASISGVLPCTLSFA
jgi:hypothetical protein